MSPQTTNWSEFRILHRRHKQKIEQQTNNEMKLVGVGPSVSLKHNNLLFQIKKFI